jgi:hypothetical protein
MAAQLAADEIRTEAHEARTEAHESLADARESLAYWERRARSLPRHRIRRRREAQVLARRWQARVAEAEREAYGRGLLGALLLVICERRLPESARRSGRHVARRTAQAATLVTAAVLALAVMAVVAAAQVAAALLDALA